MEYYRAEASKNIFPELLFPHKSFYFPDICLHTYID